MHNKWLWLNSSTMEEERYPPVSCMPVHGSSSYSPYATIAEDDCSRTTNTVNPGSSDCSSAEVKDHRDAVVAACHLLLLSNSFQSRPQAGGGWDNSPADNEDDHHVEMLREKYMKSMRDPFDEDSDSFTPASLTSGAFSPSSNECPSYGSGSHDDVGNESSSTIVTADSEVSSHSNATPTIRKRKKRSNGRLLADIVGQERESEVLDRPTRKRRYRSLSDLLRRVY